MCHPPFHDGSTTTLQQASQAGKRNKHTGLEKCICGIAPTRELHLVVWNHPFANGINGVVLKKEQLADCQTMRQTALKSEPAAVCLLKVECPKVLPKLVCCEHLVVQNHSTVAKIVC